MRNAIEFALSCLFLTYTVFAADYRFVKIDFPNAIETMAGGINARGDIVGRYQNASGVVHGFLLHKGVFTSIDVAGASFVSARAINARGDIAGRMTGADGLDHAFLLRHGQFTQIDYPGASGTVGRGINNAGDVTGNYIDGTGTEVGFVLQEGKFQSVLADPCSSDVWMAMDNGQVLIGDNCTDNGIFGFLRDKGGKFHTILFPVAGSLPCTGPRWINERGDIVGLYVVANSFDECFDPGLIRGFVLRHGKYVALDVTGAVSTSPLSMNDDGIIVGGYTDRHGVTHGFAALPNDAY